jgi:hypothetical protein
MNQQRTWLSSRGFLSALSPSLSLATLKKSGLRCCRFATPKVIAPHVSCDHISLLISDGKYSIAFSIVSFVNYTIYEYSASFVVSRRLAAVSYITAAAMLCSRLKCVSPFIRGKMGCPHAF